MDRVLASNQRTFTYRSGSSINVTAPSSSTVGAGDVLSVSFSYASSVGSYSTPRWAYKIGSNYNISSTGTEVNAVSVPGSQWLNGFSHGQSSTVYLALLHPSTGEELAYASKWFNYSTFDGSSISITSPGSGDVYAGDDLTVSYSYASSGGGYSSPRWAYSTSSYGWQSAVESYSTRVGGSQWLNHLFDGYDSTRTLYVRLLDQGNGSVLWQVISVPSLTVQEVASMLLHQAVLQLGQVMYCLYPLVMPQALGHTLLLVGRIR